jgi:hypothetical protein
MDKRRRKQVMLAAASSAMAAAGAVVLFLMFGEMSLAIIGAINGTIVVALIVDWFNRRDDSRPSKRPPDAP